MTAVEPLSPSHTARAHPPPTAAPWKAFWRRHFDRNGPAAVQLESFANNFAVPLPGSVWGTDGIMPLSLLEQQLFVAISRRDPGSAKTLIDMGADPNEFCNEGYNAVHLAACRKECLRAVLTSGGNVNMPMHNGNTALHLAAQQGSGDCVRLCLAHGANISARNHLGVTPRDVVKRKRWYRRLVPGSPDAAAYLDRIELEIQRRRRRRGRQLSAGAIPLGQRPPEATAHDEVVLAANEAGDHAAPAMHSTPGWRRIVRAAGVTHPAQQQTDPRHHAAAPPRLSTPPPTPSQEPPPPPPPLSLPVRRNTGDQNAGPLDRLSELVPDDGNEGNGGATACSSVQLLKMLECGICLDTMDDPVTLACGHNFCKSCLEALIAHSAGDAFQCPMDRYRFPLSYPLRTSITLQRISELVCKNTRVAWGDEELEL